MKHLMVIFSALCCILFVSCTTKETVVNNYYTTSPIDSNWVIITDPYEAAHGKLFFTQKSELFLLCGITNFKSSDGGKTWSKFNMDSSIVKFNFYEGKNNILYNYHLEDYSLNQENIVNKSTDDGNTWSKINYPAFDMTGKNFMMVNSFDVCKNGDLLINFRWQPDPYTSTTIYGPIYRSTDDGFTWSMVRNGNDSLTNIGNFKTGCKNHIFARQSYYDQTSNSYQSQNISSTDNGYNWQSGPANLYIDGWFYSDSTGIIYAESNEGLKRSTDNGNTFTDLSYRFYGDVGKLAISRNGLLFCVTSYELYESLNSGIDWSPLIEKLVGISDIAVSPDGYLYFRDSYYILYCSKQPFAK